MNVVLVLGALSGGGAERQFTLLAGSLAERGHRVTLAYFEGASTAIPGLDASAVVNLAATCGAEVGGVRRAISVLLALRELTERIGPDIIYSALTAPNIFATLAAAFRPSVRVVWGFRSTNEPLDRRLPWLKSVVGMLSARVDAAISNGEAVREWNRYRGVRPKRWMVVPNGCDLRRFPRKVGCEPSCASVVGCLARFSPEKSHNVLLQAFALLHSRNGSLRLLLAGPGNQDQISEMRRNLLELGIAEAVDLLGSVMDAGAFLRSLDVYVCASSFEGFPNAVMEAMASGVATVSTDVGAIRELVGESGIVVRPNDATALASAVEALVRDPQRRQTLADRARARVEGLYSSEAMVSRTCEVLEAVRAQQ